MSNKQLALAMRGRRERLGLDVPSAVARAGDGISRPSWNDLEMLKREFERRPRGRTAHAIELGLAWPAGTVDRLYRGTLGTKAAIDLPQYGADKMTEPDVEPTPAQPKLKKLVRTTPVWGDDIGSATVAVLEISELLAEYPNSQKAEIVRIADQLAELPKVVREYLLTKWEQED